MTDQVTENRRQVGVDQHKMKKSDKKTDNAIREALTEVCEVALEKVDGFQWLTHFANYSDFPNSLSVVCVFDSCSDLSNALNDGKGDYLCRLLDQYLRAMGIQLKDMKKHVSFDSEEACRNDHDGKWSLRFNK